MSRSGVLIYNPASGRQRARKKLPRLLRSLRDAGYEVEPEPTRGPADATRIAREHAERHDVEVVFALGGDGTLRETAEGLLGSDVILGPLPEGTANVLAYELGLPRTSLRAARAMARAEPRTFDVGLAESLDGARSIPFLMMASCGLDAAVMATQNATLKRLFGPAGVAMSGLRRLFSYRFPPFELEVDGETETVYFFSACNIPQFGGPFRLAPDARTDDGLLDLVTFDRTGRLAAAGLAWGVLTGRHLGRPGVRLRRVEEVTVKETLFDGLQIDGDLLDVPNPVRLRVERGALRVMSLRP